MDNKNSLVDLYAASEAFLFPTRPDDFKFMGYNQQGFPIFGSEKECCSFEYIEFDIGKGKVERTDGFQITQ
jgi:hypothetical protein